MSTTPDLPESLRQAIYDFRTSPITPGIDRLVAEIETYAREAVRLAARASVPAGFVLVAVKGFEPLVGALDRASRKGYMPDAMTEQWEAFDYRDAPTPPDEATSRAQFEAWLLKYPASMRANVLEAANRGESMTWDAWQAARTQGDAA